MTSSVTNNTGSAIGAGARRRRAKAALFALVFFAAGAWMCWQHQPLRKPFTIDNQIYFYMAERVASGVPPYVSFVDHKHALSSLLSGGAIYLGRLAGVGDVLSARLLSMGMASATVSLVWLLGFLLSRSEVASCLAALVSLTFVDFFMQATMGVRPKTFMTFFMMLAVVLFGHRRRVAAGAAACASFLCWQPALLVLGAFGPAVLLERDRWRQAGRVALGALLVLAAYEAYFAWHGALGLQLYLSYVLPSGLASYGKPSLEKSIAYFTSMGLPRKDWERLLPWSFVASQAVAWVWLLARPRQAWRFLRDHTAWVAALTCAQATLLFTFLTHQGYPDMFFVQPWIAIGAGLLFAYGAAALGKLLPRGGSVVRWVIVAAVACGLSNLALSRRDMFGFNQRLTLQDQVALADEVEDLRAQHGSVWAIGCPHLLAFHQRENWVPFGLLIDPRVREYMKELAGGGEYRPLRDGKLPEVILDSRGGAGLIIPWMRREYEKQDAPEFRRQGIWLWIRKPVAASGIVGQAR